MRITISGPPGSGKSTACAALAERVGAKAVVFGMMFRELAAEKHLSLSQLGDLAEKDPSIDNMIDDRILDIARSEEDVILESRLSAYMLERNGIPAFKIYLTASPDVRMRRVGVREGQTLEQATSETEERERSEARRYMQWYGIDISDLGVYDLVLNTDRLDPGQVIEAIMEGVRGHAD